MYSTVIGCHPRVCDCTRICTVSDRARAALPAQREAHRSPRPHPSQYHARR